ncbi:MAG TPA: hypothetical protein VNT75_05170 [Symbiobacteriaceae bacterium]|nr:hypothetical protein [Symbiobacteriaceae bacterium]
MNSKVVEAPLSLLLAPDLPATHKVLWLAIRLHSQPVSRARLASSAALDLHTVRRALSRLEAAGPSPQTGTMVTIPAGLLAEPRLRPQAKLLYGILQTMPVCTYIKLSETAHVSVTTVKQCVRELAEAGWITTHQAHKFDPIRFTLQEPDTPEVALSKKRLEEAHYSPEAIMKECLSLLIDSDEFEDNARPGFLVNPLTGERMELDRYYPRLAVGFEYNGAQHFRTTKRFPSAQKLTMQQARDLMKEAICARRGIRIIVITRADLNLSTMRKKVARIMPLRPLDRRQALIAFLEQL